MSENTTSKPNPGADSSPNPAPDMKSVSTKKLEANRRNAQKSTGPRTEAGKAKAAGNSYQHGFFAKNLFLTSEQEAKDGADYLAAADGIYGHYQPEGYLENFWVEKIAALALRSTRLLAHEQKMLAWRAPFETRSASNLARYQSSVNREMTAAIKELERLQEIRKTRPNPSEPINSDKNELHEPDQSGDGLEEAGGEASADPCTCSAPAEAGVERQEAPQSRPPTHESRGTNPTAAETSGLAAAKTEDSDGGAPEARAESQPPSKDENDGTNPRMSLADLVTEVLEHDDFSP